MQCSKTWKFVCGKGSNQDNLQDNGTVCTCFRLVFRRTLDPFFQLVETKDSTYMLTWEISPYPVLIFDTVLKPEGRCVRRGLITIYNNSFGAWRYLYLGKLVSEYETDLRWKCPYVRLFAERNHHNGRWWAIYTARVMEFWSPPTSGLFDALGIPCNYRVFPVRRPMA